MHADFSGPNFEDNIVVINEEIQKRRNLWTLSSIAHMDYDDVSQIIRIHIYDKWASFDVNRPMKPYLNKIIANQIKNIIRNMYGNYAKPCLRCCAAEPENSCKIYVTQCSKCPMFASWEKSKKPALEVKMPVPIEYHMNDKETGYFDEQDIDSAAKVIHAKMETILKPSEWTVYKALFIDNLPEVEVAKKMGYRTSEKGRISGYKQLANMRKTIIAKVKRALANDEIDLI